MKTVVNEIPVPSIGVHSAFSKLGAGGRGACGGLSNCCMRLPVENAKGITARLQLAVVLAFINKTRG